MSALRPKSLVVVGRDCELWLAVVTLAHALVPAGVSVTAIELPSRLGPGDILATLPPLEALHERIGIPRGALPALAGASLSLGQNFVIGPDRPSTFFHAWGPYGQPIDGHEFLHCWLRARAAGSSVGLERFSLAAEAARQGRILLDDDSGEALRQGGEGCHLHAIAYAACLKSLAARRGILVRQTRRISLETDEMGTVAAVVLDGAERVSGQLFVDASGEDAVLIGDSPGHAREPWRNRFGTDRTLSALAPPFTATPPFAEIRTGTDGWTALHPAPSATGILHAFRSEFTSDAQATEAARAAAGAPLTQVTIRPLASGARREPWAGNCVAVGTAAARLDPLHDLDLHVLQLGLLRLIALFPASATFEAERREYNRTVRLHLERLRDFQGAFYALAPCQGRFWRRDARPMTETLEHTLATFRACAQLAPQEHETFLPDSWYACLLGLGLLPEQWPPSTDRLPLARLREEMGRMLAVLRRKVLSQPLHDAHLRALTSRRTPAGSLAPALPTQP